MTLVLEMVLIGLQAFRGTTSHFNVATLFDGVVFTIMGAAIVVQTLSTVAVAVALWRQQLRRSRARLGAAARDDDDDRRRDDRRPDDAADAVSNSTPRAPASG